MALDMFTTELQATAIAVSAYLVPNYYSGWLRYGRTVMLLIAPARLNRCRHQSHCALV